MRFLLVSIFAAYLFSLLPSFGEEPKVRRIPGSSEGIRDFAERWEEPPEWTFEDAGELTLKMQGQSTVMMLNGRTELYKVEWPEYVDEAVVSEDGSELALVLMKKTERGGSNYAATLHVHLGDGKLVFNRILENEQDILNGSRWWVSKAGAISNDGSIILVELGVTKKGETRMWYDWYTIDLSEGRVLSKGLVIANGKQEGPE